jgi:hypothetical protein
MDRWVDKTYLNIALVDVHDVGQIVTLLVDCIRAQQNLGMVSSGGRPAAAETAIRPCTS